MSNPSTPSPSPPPPSQPPRAVSADEAARLELEALMRSSPMPEAPEDGPIEGSDDNPDQADSDAVAQVSNEHFPVTPQPPVTLSLRNELDKAERRAAHAKLSPYQRDMVKDLVKMTSVAREAELFIAMCALDNKLDKIVAAIPPFAVNPALMENIKSYSISVLLSSKLGAYKGIVPRDHVIAIIKKHQQRHLGNDFDRDHHAQKELKTVVNYELTQARSDLKKEIHKSMVDNSTIFSLATKVVAGTQCSVTVPLSSRIALLRKVMVTHNNTKYWDHIDARLKMIRDTAGGDQKKIDKAFTTYLQTDRKTYGIDTGYKIDEGSDDHLQQSIDTVIMGDNMAVTSS